MVPGAREKDSSVKFQFVYPNTYGKYRKREVGIVHSIKKGGDDFKTLKHCSFHIGDYIDLTIITNKDKHHDSTAPNPD